MTVSRLRRVSAAALVIIGIAMVLWVSLPAGRVAQEISYVYGQAISPPEEWVDLQIPPALTDGEIKVEYPGWIWLGDSGQIRMTLAERGAPPSCDAGDRPADPFDLSGRLELPGVLALPGSELRQAVVDCRTALLAWTIEPETSGDYSGTLWLRLLHTGNNDDSEQSLSMAAVPLEMSAGSLAGLSAPQARVVGVLAVLIGLALNVDLVLRRE
jgi:hypothetical protein